MLLVGIAGVSAADVGTVTTQTGNHHTVHKNINIEVKDLKTLKEPITTEKKVFKNSNTVKKTVNTTKTTTQYVNKTKRAASFSKNSVKTKNNTVTKQDISKYAYGKQSKYANGTKKNIKHAQWYQYPGKVHKYKKSNFKHQEDAASSINGIKPTSKLAKSSNSSIVNEKVAAGSKKRVKYTRYSRSTSSINALARSLTRGTHSQYQKGARIFNWVRDNLRYSFYYNTKLGAAGALKYRKGNCADTSHLVVALSRAAGLQAKYAHGNVRFPSGRVIGHVWAIVKVNGRWYKADATSNRNTFGYMRGTVVRFKGIHNTLPF